MSELKEKHFLKKYGQDLREIISKKSTDRSRPVRTLFRNDFRLLHTYNLNLHTLISSSPINGLIGRNGLTFAITFV